MKTPKIAIEHNFAEIVEYLPLRHIIRALGQKQVIAMAEVARIEKDKDPDSKLLSVLKRRNLGVFLAFCNLADDAHPTVRHNYKWLIYNLRRALDSANFTWQWLDGENVIEKSQQHFPTEMACTLDGWKNRPVVKMCKPGKLLIINHTPKNKLIGVVNEVAADWLQHREPPCSIFKQNEVKQQKTVGSGFKTLFSNMVGNVKIAVAENGDHVGIDIRFWRNYNHGLIPTKKGVHLIPDRFVRLMWLQDQVADAMKDIEDGKVVSRSLHVGGGVRLLMCSPFRTVKIHEYRRYYKTYKEKNGITLTYEQWLGLLQIAHNDAELEKILPHLKYMTPCYTKNCHQYHDYARFCSECNFFTAAEESGFSTHADTDYAFQPPISKGEPPKKKAKLQASNFKKQFL